MKFLNRIVLCTSLLLTSYLTANDMCGIPEGCLPVSSGSNFLNCLSFKAEGLYLQAREDGLEYATSFHEVSRTIDGFEDSFLKYKDHSPRFSNRLGYRVGIDFCNPCSCWNIGASYLSYRTSAHGSVHQKASVSPLATAAAPTIAAPVANDLTDLQAKQTVLSSSRSGVVGLFSNFADGDILDSVCSSLKLRLDIVDVDINRSFCINECFSINPYVGFRYLRLKQKYRVRSEGIPTTSVTTHDRVRLKDDFSGWGIHAGLKSDWEFGCGLSLYGMFGGSLLCGSDHLDHKEAFSVVNTSTPTSETLLLKGRSHHKGARATAEAGLGILYDYCFCENQTIRLKLGWEFLFLSHVNRFASTIDFPDSGSSRDRRCGDLSLQGLVFGFDYGF